MILKYNLSEPDLFNFHDYLHTDGWSFNIIYTFIYIYKAHRIEDLAIDD